MTAERLAKRHAGIILPPGPLKRDRQRQSYKPTLLDEDNLMVEIPSQSGDTLTHEIVNLQIAGDDLDFETAADLARSRARKINKDAMMLAWFNRRSGEGFPDYDCGAGDKPPWRVFAEARGANLTVDVNDGEYIFMYLRL